jgi:hypothetical protein
MSTSTAEARLTGRKVAVMALKLGLVVALFYLLWSQGQLSLDKLRDVNRGWLVAGILVLWVVPVLAFVRWQLVLRGMGIRLPSRQVLGYTMIGQLFNNVVPLGPTGGDVVKVTYVRRRHRDIPLSLIISSVLADRISGMMALNILSLLGISSALVLWPEVNPRVYAAMIFGLVFFSVIFLLWTLVLLGPLGPWLQRRRLLEGEGWRERVREGIAAAQQIRRPGVIGPVMGVSLLAHVCGIGCCWFFARALGQQIGPLANFALIPIAQLANMVPLVPQGLGTFEVALDWIYRHYGLEHGALVAVCWHLAWITSGFFGLFPLLAMRASRTTAESEKVAAAPADSSQ